MIHVTFPDGSLREYAPGTTGAEIAAQISKSLSKKAVAMTLDGVLSDLNPARDNVFYYTLGKTMESSKVATQFS